jgi:hypothetical protein
VTPFGITVFWGLPYCDNSPPLDESGLIRPTRSRFDDSWAIRSIVLEFRGSFEMSYRVAAANLITCGCYVFASLLLVSMTQKVRAAELGNDAKVEYAQVPAPKWLRNVGWEIRLGKITILIDPFLTREDRSMDAEWKTDEEAVLKVITGY